MKVSKQLSDVELQSKLEIWGRAQREAARRPYCDHVAKFRGDWPRELGDCVAEKIKKTSRVKHKAFGTNVPGGLIMLGKHQQYRH